MLYFCNELFDSFNGRAGQGLSSIILTGSGHIPFWNEACNKLRNMRYVEKKSRQASKGNAPKCLRNWIWTMKAALNIWNILHTKNFESFNLKFLNQDILENFFSQIRSNGCANRNLNPAQFQTAFKTLLICNFTSKHSIGSNCTESNEGATLALSQLINLNKSKEMYSEETDRIECTEATVPIGAVNEIVLDAIKIKNFCAKSIADCTECARDLENIDFSNFLKNCAAIMEKTFVNICYEIKISEKLIDVTEAKYVSSCPFQCTDLKKVLLKIIAEEFLQTSCTIINKILCRKLEIISDNYIYNIAKKMSMKYAKKESERKYVTKTTIAID